MGTLPARDFGPDAGSDVGLAVAALMAALEAQEAVHDTVRRQAENLGHAVVRRDARAVAEATAAQQGGLADLARAGDDARAAAAALAGVLRLPADSPMAGLTSALESCGWAETAGVLAARGAQVAFSAHRARAANARNAPLLRHALAFTAFALQRLTVGAGAPAGYTASGAPRRDRHRRLVDARA